MINFRNAAFAENNTNINCEIEIDGVWLRLTLDPFTNNISDDYKELYTQMKSVASAYVPEVVDNTLLAVINMRNKRDLLLTNEVDPIVSNPFRWDSLSITKQQEWVDYRLALLSVPQQANFPNTINWPVKPLV